MNFLLIFNKSNTMLDPYFFDEICDVLLKPPKRIDSKGILSPDSVCWIYKDHELAFLLKLS